MVLSDLDRDLLNRCLASADGAWEEFIDRYLPLLSHVVTTTSQLRFSSLPNEVREDMVAEILLAIVDDDYAILRRFRGQSSFGTYLVVIARRIALRRLEKLAPVKAVPVEAASEAAAQDADMQLDDTDEVREMLGKLPDNEATVIRMYHLEHQSYSEIGHHMGIPENSVGPLLSKARDHMRALRQPS